ncbi:phosphoribosylanthranilate isomerase [Candidatus Margulisiibacteriota bacterium]
MRIKICGITNIDDAQNAVSLGASALGFIFAENSPRYITPEKAEEICMFMPPFVQLVGVFVNEKKEVINKIAEQCKLNLIQLHGNEEPGFCLNINRKVIKTFKLTTEEDLKLIPQYQGVVSAILLDTKVEGKDGGTGQVFDWGLALKAKESFDIPVILAGGINISNIKKAVQLVNPYAIDISTGVESEPGQKDYNKIKELITVAKDL